MPDRIPLERELAGLPELAAFPTSQQREAALRAIAERHEDPYDWQFWLWLAILVASAVGGAWLVVWAVGKTGASRPISAALGVVAGLATYTFLYRAVHRWAARPALREELAKLGINWPPER